MRLAFTIFTYFPFGGLQRDCLDIAETCRKRGHDITLFTMEWSGPIPEGIQLRIIRSKGLTNHARSNSFVKAVLPRLQSGKFDVVVGFNKMPGLDLYFAGDPCYVEQSRKRHGPRWNPYYWATLRYHRYSAFERAVFGPQSVTEILPLSASQERIYSAHYGTPANRFHLLPPGICHDRTPSHDDSGIRSEIRRSFLRESEKHLLLAVGTDARRKGLDRTIHAVAALPGEVRCKTRLVAVGEHRTRPFEQLARQLSISDRVTFLPPRSNLSGFFYGADLLIHPAYSEAGGTVLLESMAFGLPVLATDVCGYAEYVQAARGGLILPSPFEQAYMNQSLQHLLTPPQLSTLAENARAFTRSKSLHQRSLYVTTIIEARAERNRQRVSSI